MPTVTAPILLDSTGQQILSKLNEVSILPQIVDNLTTSDATKALSAKQGKVLNDNNTWKFVGDVMGKTVIYMPTDWREAYILLHYYGTNGDPMPFTFTWNVIKDSLRSGSNRYYFRNGFCTSPSGSEYGQCAIAYDVTANYFQLDDAYHDNHDLDTYSRMIVYYK